jgi:hypothetical protein
MAKSIITRPDGTKIIIEGTTEEISKIIKASSFSDEEMLVKQPKGKKRKMPTESFSEDTLLNIISFIKECDQADVIEKNILDRPGQIDRVLLPLYIAGQLKNKPSLSSGDIYGVLKELGIKIAIPNISNTLRKTASKYVMADRRVKKGQAAGYKLTRQGNKYMADILSAPEDDR